MACAAQASFARPDLLAGGLKLRLPNQKRKVQRREGHDPTTCARAAESYSLPRRLKRVSQDADSVAKRRESLTRVFELFPDKFRSRTRRLHRIVQNPERSE
jgi:hypothetical protein